MKKILFAALAALVVAACGPNWGYLCVGDSCSGGGGGDGVDQTPTDPDAGCPIEDPNDGGPTDPGDGGNLTDPGDGGNPTDPGDGGTDPGDGGTDPGDGGTDPGDGGSDPGDGGDGGDGKVCICHIPKGNPSNKHTICIGEPALSAHLKHGDFLGSCNW